MNVIRRSLGGALLLGALAATICVAGSSGTVSPSASLTAQPVIGLPVGSPTLIGASPNETRGETWGYSTSGGFHIVRYTPAEGWRIQAPPLEAQGQPIAGFQPAPGPLAGRATASGDVTILGVDSTLLTRAPGAPFQEAPTLTPEPPGGIDPSQPEALLEPGETLVGSGEIDVLQTPLELDGGHAGALIVPFEPSTRTQESVLYFDGTVWTREPICAGMASGPQPAECAPPTKGFKVLAIDASSPSNAWLLAANGSEGVVLFSRDTSGSLPVWRQRSLAGSPFAQARPPFEKASVHVTARAHGQPLTVTSQGVWVDGQMAIEAEGQSTTSDFTLFYQPGTAQTGRVAASWCDVPATLQSLCTNPLESNLPSGEYRSFAWPDGGPFGQRVITGLGQGVSLDLRGTAFVRVLGDGGESGTSSGAAFSSPQEGWLAEIDGPLTHLTTEPAPDQLEPWPVPFRRPLTAIAEQPGATAGDVAAEAIAVGQQGQIAHYKPEQGWTPEALLSSSGVAQTPDLRGVAWPEPGRAYAVGTHGAMWLWQAATELWEPDPAKPPNLFLANFTGIAFEAGNPTRGYAIGQQGLLLAYGKTWTQEPTCGPEASEASEACLPASVAQASFTSIAFAGKEALVSFQIPHFDPAEGHGYGYSGGLLVNDGAGWRVDASAAEALGTNFPEVPVRVAGLADGSAVFATANGRLFKRQGLDGQWQPSSAGSSQYYPVALAAFHEAGALRALVSIDASRHDDLGEQYAIDRALEQAPPAGQAPVVTGAYPLPGSGFLLRETANGWEDLEHQDYPIPNTARSLPGQKAFDWPVQPDATLALALDPDGSQAWAVGGQTGEVNNIGTSSGEEHAEAIQTAGVMRYPAGGQAPTGFTSSPIPTNPANATFMIGGEAQCATACADLAEDQIGPDEWLATAISQANQTPGVRAFLYTGSHLAPGIGGANGISAGGFQREADRYAQLLLDAAGMLPVFAAPSQSDVDRSGDLQSFGTAMQALQAPQGSAPPAIGIAPTSPAGANVSYFSFDSTRSGGKVRVIVLDYSRSTLGSTQQCWLAEQLALAKAERAPAIVIGNRDLSSTGESGNLAADAGQVVSILVSGTPPAGCTPGLPPAGASAYFFDSPQQSRSFPLTVAGASIPSFGSGTLGYVATPGKLQTQFLGASGSLLAEVEVAKRNVSTNRAPVSVRLVPDISELALDAANGVLLRRSQATLFTGLGRRPHAGMKCEYSGATCEFQPDPYVPIPSTCQGSACATAILPEYTFTSSNPDIGDFVEPDPASPESTTVLQGANGKPIPDAHSGLFCAYNAGSTTITVRTGGLAYSEQVRILSGSVQQPCGTTPLRNPPKPAQQAGLPVPLATPAPTITPKGTLPLPPPLPAIVPVHHAVAHKSHVPQQIPPRPSVQLFPVLALVPPPAPSVARPTPPSGGAQVPSQSPISQQVSVTEREREVQSATEGVHHMAAYRHPEEAPMPAWPLGLILIAALSGVGIHRRFRSPELAYTSERGIPDQSNA